MSNIFKINSSIKSSEFILNPPLDEKNKFHTASSRKIEALFMTHSDGLKTQQRPNSEDRNVLAFERKHPFFQMEFKPVSSQNLPEPNIPEPLNARLYSYKTTPHWDRLVLNEIETEEGSISVEQNPPPSPPEKIVDSLTPEQKKIISSLIRILEPIFGPQNLLDSPLDNDSPGPVKENEFFEIKADEEPLDLQEKIDHILKEVEKGNFIEPEDFKILLDNYNDEKLNRLDTEISSKTYFLYNILESSLLDDDSDVEVSLESINRLIDLHIENNIEKEDETEISHYFLFRIIYFIQSTLFEKNNSQKFIKKAQQLLSVCMKAQRQPLEEASENTCKIFTINLEMVLDKLKKYTIDDNTGIHRNGFILLLNCAFTILKNGIETAALREKTATATRSFIIKAIDHLYTKEDCNQIINFIKNTHRILKNTDKYPLAFLTLKKLASLYLYQNNLWKNLRPQPTSTIRPYLQEKRQKIQKSIAALVQRAEIQNEDLEVIYENIEDLSLTYPHDQQEFLTKCLLNLAGNISASLDSGDKENDLDFLETESAEDSYSDIEYIAAEEGVIEEIPNINAQSIINDDFSILQPMLPEHSRFESESFEDEIDWDNLTLIQAIQHLQTSVSSEKENWADLPTLIDDLIQLYPENKQKGTTHLLMPLMYEIILDALQNGALPLGPLQGVFLNRVKGLLDIFENLCSNFSKEDLPYRSAKHLNKLLKRIPDYLTPEISAVYKTLSTDHPEQHPLTLLFRCASTLMQAGFGTAKTKNSIKICCENNVLNKFPKLADKIKKLITACEVIVISETHSQEAPF